MSLESFCVDNTGAAFVVVDLVDIIARIREDELKGHKGRKKESGIMTMSISTKMSLSEQSFFLSPSRPYLGNNLRAEEASMHNRVLE